MELQKLGTVPAMDIKEYFRKSVRLFDVSSKIDAEKRCYQMDLPYNKEADLKKSLTILSRAKLPVPVKIITRVYQLKTSRK